uniref:hypothetical protein n=1 Tax=Alistipes putredinis TaxID=28117 RepID=UPI003FD7E5A6
MMNFASMKFFLVGLTLTAMLSACSDDETSDLIPEPSISISALESEIGALNFSINVEIVLPVWFAAAAITAYV